MKKPKQDAIAAIAERFFRLASRKFLAAVGAEAAAASTFWAPSTGDVWADVVLRLGALAAMALTAFGYAATEAKLDASRDATAPPEP